MNRKPGLRPMGQLPGPGHLSAQSKRPQRQRQASPAERLHHRRADRLRARLAEALPKSKPYFMYLSHKAVHAEFEPRQAPQGPLQGRQVHPSADDGRRPATWRSIVRCGCRTSATSGTASTIPTTRRSISPSITSATPRLCWRWTRASGACWTSSRSAANSTPRWSFTWATTASHSASTGSSTSAPPTRNRCASRCWRAVRSCSAAAAR